ncbi:uncharacterized protein LOC116307044 [Actinia tenebrosa]|uniref:Uncharacterized protein LOC116307044 n=1 Tax=Actinia tenebrosa TaxID=6105 RepID=A0A6P8J4Y1_ACTTE|nr:uncharacterized protein LOC116307044 [Actinia tenebrosa]
MKFQIASIVLLAVIFQFGHRVSGKCQGPQAGLFDTDWATCLPAVDKAGTTCPHNFLKIGDNSYGCGESHTFIRDSNHRRVVDKPFICCLLTPVIDMKVKDAPCLSNSGGSNSQKDLQDKIESKSH